MFREWKRLGLDVSIISKMFSFLVGDSTNYTSLISLANWKNIFPAVFDWLDNFASQKYQL